MVLRTLMPAGIPLVYVLASGVIFTLVLKCHADEKWQAWARQLEAPLRAAGVESLFLNWNPAAGRRALSSRHQKLVFGKELVIDGGHLHGALSFRQQIPELEGAALGRAEKHLAGAELIVDLYSGAGASLTHWLALGARVAGVELVAEACRAAEQNAPGAVVLKGRVEHRLPQLDEIVGKEPFSLYTNPPRSGHEPEVIAWMLSQKPLRIAYLSCNSKSQARDLAALSAQYEITGEIWAMDFFPQTDHVECLALLTKKTS
jgi:23S rRNA (uracil1939-C5)-methyltransferase